MYLKSKLMCKICKKCFLWLKKALYSKIDIVADSATYWRNIQQFTGQRTYSGCWRLHKAEVEEGSAKDAGYISG